MFTFQTHSHQMTSPTPPQDCPPGLEYLTQIDQLSIRQQIQGHGGKLAFHAAGECRRHVINLTNFVKNVKIVEFHGHI